MRISDWSSDVCSSDLLGAIGEGRGLIDADPLSIGPVGHVFRRRIMVQIALHVAVHQRLKAHLQRVFMQGRKRTWLVALGFGEETPASQEGEIGRGSGRARGCQSV